MNCKIHILIFLTCALFMACTGEKFTVKGNITNAKDSVLYFENWSLEGPVVLDSVRLSDDGTFTFQAEAADAPEFYRLRIHDQIINVSADSTETVTIKAQYPEMAWKYEVSGSDNCKKIQELTQLQIALQNQCILIAQNQQLDDRQADDSINVLIAAHKQRVITDYIVKEPMKAYAYFALFQAVGNRLIFDPRADKNDVKMYAAVATSWDTYYPGSLRGANLHNIAIEGMKTQRIVAAQNQQMDIDPSKINTTNMIELNLQSNRGANIALSSLKGKVVLLDFHAFSQEGSTEYEMALREIYQKYHDRGLEIYQVGLDNNAHFWKQQVSALPWVNVYDPEGASLRLYNVQQIPCGFILDRECAPVLRYTTLQGLEAQIQKHL